jgi:hypothetical protein
MIGNLGNVDRGIRAALGASIAILLLAGVVGGTYALVLGVVAILLFGTALIGWCPLYAPFGLSTKHEAKA